MRWFLLLALGTSAFGQGYVVRRNVQVSAALPAVRHYETYVAADRKDARHLIACAYVVRPGNRVDTVFYVSFDRGDTWENTLTIPMAVDPSCAIGLDGAAFAASVHDLADEKGTPVLSVYRSGDGGRTWLASRVSVDAPPIDRAYLTVDDTDSAFKKRVYVHAYRYSRTPPATVLFFPGGNEGRSFEKMLVNGAATFERPWFFPGNGVVGSDGAFYALMAEMDDSKRNMSYRTDAASAPAAANSVLSVYVSRDGGKTLALAGKIADAFYDWRVPQVSMPSLAVDRSRDRLYAVWPDARFEHRTQILFASSMDHGRTWTAPALIERDGTASNSFMPVVAVNRSGVVGVSWYDRRDNSDNLGYYVRFAASVDGGKSWLPSVRVSSVAHVADDDMRKNGGDTAGLTADADGVFHPVWIDNRTGIPQAWTAGVRVK
jgi:hypothetical protein